MSMGKGRLRRFSLLPLLVATREKCMHSSISIRTSYLVNKWYGSLALMWWYHRLQYFQIVAVPVREYAAKRNISAVRLKRLCSYHRIQNTQIVATPMREQRSDCSISAVGLWQ
jgi:hypothetical protein